MKNKILSTWKIAVKKLNGNEIVNDYLWMEIT